MPAKRARFARSAVWAACAVGGVLIFALILPIAPINSAWWNVTNRINDNLREEIGWPDLVQAVARVRDSLPAEERARFAILAGNYGEAGAIDLYGPAYGLPKAICGVNSYWLRGYGDPRSTPVAAEFDRWLGQTVALPPTERQARLADWARASGPAGRLCHPPRAEEHLLPLHVAAGAAGDGVGRCVFTDRVMAVDISAFRFD